MNTEVKTVTGYALVDNAGPWDTFKTIDDAKHAARRCVINKYLNKNTKLAYEPHYNEYEEDGFWNREGRAKVYKRGYKEAYQFGAAQQKSALLEQFLEFYDDIIPKLNEIDEQKVKEVK